jgi:16S rRNA (guanine527-N7)-methyltransferase
VEFAIEQMGWADAEAVSGRAEEVAHETGRREAYDVVVARAVAAMRLLSEFCLPFVRVGGVFLAMKGPSVEDEMRPALSAVDRLGGRPEPPVPFTLPFGGGERAIVPIAKVSATPERFPRLYRDIKRQPL